MNLFGCSHTRYSWPLTRRVREFVSGIQRQAGTYVCCLECGKEFEYDWENMRVIPEKEQRRKERIVYGDL